jgi:hypothetical protein
MKKPTSTQAIGALMLILAIIVIYQSLNLSNLTKRSDNTVLLDRMDNLEGQQDGLRLDLDAIAGLNFVTTGRYEKDQHTLNERLKAYTEAPQTDWQQLRDDITALAAQADRVQQELSSLQEHLTRPPAPAPTQAVRKHPPSRPKPQTPPFEVIGLEYRGGETFLAVSPNHNTSLNQVQLLHAGDSHQSWLLQSLDSDTAHFRLPDGSRRTLAIR